MTAPCAMCVTDEVLAMGYTCDSMSPSPALSLATTDSRCHMVLWCYGECYGEPEYTPLASIW